MAPPRGRHSVHVHVHVHAVLLDPPVSASFVQCATCYVTEGSDDVRNFQLPYTLLPEIESQF